MIRNEIGRLKKSNINTSTNSFLTFHRCNYYSYHRITFHPAAVKISSAPSFPRKSTPLCSTLCLIPLTLRNPISDIHLFPRGLYPVFRLFARENPSLTRYAVDEDFQVPSIVAEARNSILLLSNIPPRRQVWCFAKDQMLNRYLMTGLPDHLARSHSPSSLFL